MHNNQIINGMPWTLLFPFVCWELWKQRNSFIFEQKPVNNPPLTIKTALRAAWEFKHYTQSPHPPPTPLDQVATPLSHPWVQINVDASFLNPIAKASIAGIIRNEHGEWLLGFHRMMYATNALHAELLAIKEGLLAAETMNQTHIIITSDCQKAINMLDHDTRGLDAYSDILSSCRELLWKFQEKKTKFVRRENNRLADMLARESRNLYESCNHTLYFYDPPMYCQNIYLDDCNGFHA